HGHSPEKPKGCRAGMSWSKGWGKDWSKGKGKSSASEDAAKLATIDASQKVWVGSIPEGVDWKTLQQHFNQVSRTIYAAVFPRSGTGCVAYKTPEEVQAAVQSLNRSWLGPAQIEVDYFITPAGRKGKGKTGYSNGDMGVWKPMFQKTWTPSWGGGKGKGKGKGLSGDVQKLRSIDNSLKVWVGGLDGSVTWKSLEEHFTQVAKPTWATVFPKGTGCVALPTANDVQLAVSMLNGTSVGGCVIEVDVFTGKQAAA
ncbi:unnamed protein product, partial [Symbiodinium microadriaticum]